MRCLKTIFCTGIVLVVASFLTGASLRAQTASSSTVTGTVYDKSGATVPNAKVDLEDVDTKAKTSVTTGNDGGYTFPSVRPGNYNVIVSAKGFRQTAVSHVKVDIGKSALVNAVLEVGGITEVVEVTAGTGVELQTQNSSVGDVLDAKLLANMPTLSRDATALVLLQPMAIPGFNGPGGTGEGNSSGGTIAGARMDQNTFMLDGGDATSNMEGGGGYNNGFVATPRAVVPTPVESLEEFRVQTNNAGVDFTRSLGAEVQMITRRGTNTWHGAGYWYHQNDELNANDWFRNRRPNTFTGKPFTENPEWRDNRYGGRIGGPIWKDRTFFFVHEEERHFFTQSVFQRLVPSDALKAGILKFKDKTTGVVTAFNLNPTPTLDVAACSSPCVDNDPLIGTMLPGDNGTLDPRKIGLNPAIAAEWANLPPPNDFSAGDAALRAPLFTSAVPNISNEHFAVVRLDHKISDTWDFMGSYRYSTSSITPPNIQEDIGGIAKGCQKGVPCPLASRPLQPRFLVAGLTTRLTSNLVNEFHFNWLRHWWSWIAPGAGILPISSSLSDTPLQIWSESRINAMVPINVNTQQARQRVWNGQDYTFIDNLSWIRGKHAWTFGGRVQFQHFLHVRDDKVVGGITTPLYFVARGGQFLDIGGVPIPASVKSSDKSTFRRAYISALGLVDSATQVLTRAGDLSPQPAGSTITQKENVNAYELYFGDTWRLSPSLTLSYGLTWGVQMPPNDPTGKTAMMIDVSTGKPIDAKSYLAAKNAAALNGDAFNPTIGYVPIKSTGRKYPFDPDYTNWGPRLAFAWNPSFSGGPLGGVLGNRKTVLRGGWSRAFERKNGVGLVLTPALGIGFGDLSVCTAPDTTGACSGFSNPTTAFRIGVDGNHITVPPLPTVSGGVIIPGEGSPSGIQPANANSVFESRDFRLDPHYVTGGSDSIDFSVQRELPGKMILEVGYVGRWSRDLYGNIDLNHIPYMFTPKGTKQTFAQAFDAVAAELQGGKDPSAVTSQPWFEAMLPASFCSGFSSCTSAAAVFDSNNGNPYWPFHGAGALWTLLEPNFTTGPMTLANTQVGSLDWSGSFTYANYHAGFITLRSRAYNGLTFDANYTYSHALDNFGITQECTGAIPDAFDHHRSYGPSLFDRRHTFNLLVNYELPFGKGKKVANGAFADRVFGGWSVSGVYVAASGLPDMVYDSTACFSEFGSTPSNGNSVGLIPTGSGTFNQTRVNNPTSNSNYGTGSTGGVPNMFKNPDALGCATTLQGCVDASGNPLITGLFRYPTFADKTLGFGRVRGPMRWNLDLAVSKLVRITERVSTRFDVQFVNAFNHVMFGSGGDSYFSNQPGMDLSGPGAFGVPSNQFNSPRYIQMGLRFDF